MITRIGAVLHPSQRSVPHRLREETLFLIANQSAVCFSIRLSFEPIDTRTSSSPSRAPGRIERPSELAVLVSFLTALSLLRRHMEKDKTEGGGKEQTRGNN
jgi:hypothetical protein